MGAIDLPPALLTGVGIGTVQICCVCSGPLGRGEGRGGAGHTLTLAGLDGLYEHTHGSRALERPGAAWRATNELPGGSPHCTAPRRCSALLTGPRSTGRRRAIDRSTTDASGSRGTDEGSHINYCTPQRGCYIVQRLAFLPGILGNAHPRYGRSAPWVARYIRK